MLLCSFQIAGCFCSGEAAAWGKRKGVNGERENGERNDKIDKKDEIDKKFITHNS
jgi:hypothetical protein